MRNSTQIQDARKAFPSPRLYDEVTIRDGGGHGVLRLLVPAVQ